MSCSVVAIGYKRTIAAEKKAGRMDLQEGKLPLSFVAYNHLARKSMFNCVASADAYSHLFLLLCWNLMARCTSIANINYKHIFWTDDCMHIVFPAHKGDEAGDNAAPKHVYANVENPELCPILAFALYEFSFGARTGRQQRVFVESADNAESRFSKWLQKSCKDDPKLIELGINLADIGTHSFRKGASTYLFGLSGFCDYSALFLRAGWSMGQIPNR